jgi:hypothetical protein
VLEKGCAFGDVGRIEKAALEVLEKIQHNLRGRLLKYQEERRWIPQNARVMDFSMRSTLTRLQDCPMTFRDVIAQFADFQRICLDLKGVMDFIGIFEPRLQTPDPPPCADMSIMGSFTSNPEVASKMFKCGIPVWLVRTRSQLPPNIKIRRIVPYTIPSRDIISDEWHDEQTNVHKPFPSLHYGFGGTDRHDKTRLMGSAMFDIPSVEGPTSVTPLSGAFPAVGADDGVESAGRETTSSVATLKSARHSPCKHFIGMSFRLRSLTCYCFSRR